MKSIYLEDNLHSRLKFVAALEKKSLTRVVEEFLNRELRKKLADLPTEMVQKLAAVGGSFDFLENEGEDIYSERDGKPVA